MTTLSLLSFLGKAGVVAIHDSRTWIGKFNHAGVGTSSRCSIATQLFTGFSSWLSIFLSMRKPAPRSGFRSVFSPAKAVREEEW
jgi:hypothetical protein